MTLLITVFAAVAAAVAWYRSAEARKLKVGLLCWMFWGAAAMWLADAMFEYAELGAAYFAPAPADMLNDAFLGLSVVALALVIWVAALFFTDPQGTVRAALQKGKR